MRWTNPFLFGLFLLLPFCLQTQSDPDSQGKVDQLEEEIQRRTVVLDSLKQSLVKMREEMRTLPYWTMAMGGIFGMDVNRFSNWAGRGEYLNSSSASISTTLDAKAHLVGENFFWRNNGRVTLSWNKLEVKGEETSR